VGSEVGWEVAVFDHYRAVLDALARKLHLKATNPELARWVGGATLVFDLHEQHPMKDEAFALLERVRGEVNSLWQRVSDYNSQHPIPPEAMFPMTFYFGQNVEFSTNGIKTPTLGEVKNKVAARKSIVAAKNIIAGEVLSNANLTVKRPGDGLSPMLWEQLIGTKAKRDYQKDEKIE
jgi:sialic acid synthase SpsE